MAQTDSLSASVHSFTMTSLQGEEVSLGDYAGKVVVIVNVASKCGLTPQYEDLQRFYTEYADRGVVVLGFPANNFAGQEPGTNEEIAQFCSANYGVSFPMFSKISVKGKEQHPLYQFLEEATGEKPGWNFHKYLINQEGQVVASISPQTGIYDPKVMAMLKELGIE
ncbi:MAG: glutathione peroxidase [Bacteroidia bacterium]|nr:glutathione peroxidase [Bacteroidia bacterium]